MSAPHKRETRLAGRVFAGSHCTNENRDCRGAASEAQAEGARYASALMRRILLGTYRPGELASMVAFLHGPMLPGACAVIEQAMLGALHA